MTEIWLTGIGIVSPLGIGAEAVRVSLREGLSGIAPITLFDVGDYPVRKGAEVKAFRAKDYVRNRKALKVSRRNIHLALAAGNLAWKDAELEDKVAPDRAGVVMSAGRLGATLEEVCYAVRDAMDTQGQLSLAKYAETSSKLMPPYWFLRHIPNLVPGTVAIDLGLRAPCNTLCVNVTGSLMALAEAASIIGRGEADVMLAGGADCLVDPYHLVTHHLLGRLDAENPEGPRPFTESSRGTILGETGTIVVLERAESARSRGKSPLAIWRGSYIGRPTQILDRDALRNGLKPDLTVLGGTGIPDLDSTELALASPDSFLTCYRNRTGWMGGSNGVHDLACILLDREEPSRNSKTDTNGRLHPERWHRREIRSCSKIAIQSLSWSGLFGSVILEIP